MRTIREEEIGEAGCGHTEVGPGAHLPLLAQDFAVYTFDDDVLDSTCNRVKPRCKRDDVELVEGSIFLADAVSFEATDGVILDVNDIDVGSVELVIKVLLQREALGAEGVGRDRWGEEFSFDWVVNALAYMIAPEFVSFHVAVHISRHVDIVVH